MPGFNGGFFDRVLDIVGGENAAEQREKLNDAKKNIKTIQFLIRTAPVWGTVLGIGLILLVFICIIAGNEGNQTDYRSVYSTYGYCDSINVNGTLYSLENYVAGVVQHEAYTSEGEEALKAQAIAARTYAIHYTGGCQRAIGNSQSSQTFSANPGEAAKKAADDTAGLVLFYNDNIFSAMYDSFCYSDKDCPDARKNADGSYTVTYTKKPAGEKHTITLSDSSYYGRIVPGGGHASGMSQLVSYQLAKGGMSYEQILKYFYSDGVEIVSILPGTSGSSESAPGHVDHEKGQGYSTTYMNVKNGKTYYNYKQCGFGIEWLCNVGCGVTSTSIIMSGEEKLRAITPSYLYYNYRKPLGYVSMVDYFSRYMNGKYKKLNGATIGNAGNKQRLTKHLSDGGTAIIFLDSKKGCGYIKGLKWTGSQHFVAVLDYDSSNNKIYISNPGTNNILKNGWKDIDNFDCAEISYLID